MPLDCIRELLCSNLSTETVYPAFIQSLHLHCYVILGQHLLYFSLFFNSPRLATGWTVRGSNPGGGEAFRTCPDRPWGAPSLLYNGHWVFPGGRCKERPGRDADPSPPSSAIGHERVELYLYSPYGPYGLYRASVPVQGCTLPYFTLLYFTLRK